MIFHFNLCLVCSFAADAAADDDVATDDLDDVEKNCAYSHGRRWILILTRPTCCRRVRWSECNEVLEKHLEGCDVDNLPPNFDVSEIVWCFNFVDIDDEANDDSEFIRLPEVTDNILIPDRAMILLLSNLCTPPTREVDWYKDRMRRRDVGELEEHVSHKNKMLSSTTDSTASYLAWFSNF